jgi:hypothetical protein
MKTQKTRLLFAIILGVTLPLVVWAAVIVDDRFADGNSQNQDLANNSLRLFNGRAGTVRTDAMGSVTFDVTGANGADGFWAFFTDPGQPIKLNVGDSLTVAVTFSLQGFQRNAQDLRFCVGDSLGTRTTSNPTGGMNNSSFVGDSAYNLQFFGSGMGQPLRIGRRIEFASTGILNTSADFAAITTEATGATERQELADNTPYTLTYTIARLSAMETLISAAVAGGTLSDMYSTVVETNSEPNTSFDYFGVRLNGPSTRFTDKITFTRLLVDSGPAAPVITAQPRPATMRVPVGGSVILPVAARGPQVLSYEWRKNDTAVTGNASATTPTLTLNNLQSGDSGNYTVVVRNANGSTTSRVVNLTVTTDSVPPPPTITTQPANTTVAVGASASLSVTAQGDSLVYQWFKNGVLVPGATGATLTFSSAQASNSGTYTVLVSNPSGSVLSASAMLVVQ